MGSVLSQDDIEDLLVVCGTTPTVWNAHGNMQVCCPVHGEVNPSLGVSSEKQVAHCFSCGFAGGFAKLLFSSQPDQFRNEREAQEFIEFNYDVSFETSGKAHRVRRYEQQDRYSRIESSKNPSIPMYKIAPYKSGKETYKYFFKRRGFTKSDMQRFMIGRDVVHKTVTIPVFNEDGTLAGVIGRYIDKHRKKNERYKIYDHFNRGNLLYPIDKTDTSTGTLILVEGQFDAIRLFHYGYENVVAKAGLNLTTKQANWIKNHCDRLIYLYDNDERGRQSKEDDLEKLDGVDVLFVDYPDYGKDVCDWEEADIREMLDGAGTLKRGINRYD